MKKLDVLFIDEDRFYIEDVFDIDEGHGYKIYDSTEKELGEIYNKPLNLELKEVIKLYFINNVVQSYNPN